MQNIKLVLLGVPGAGKGTQAERISDVLHIPTISTGAIIREAIATGSEMGLNAKTFIERGDLVPDLIVIEIIRRRLSKPDCKNGYILDGFPRTVSQAKALEEMGERITHVISIDVDDETIICRLGGRRVCRSCGETYHTVFNPSPAGDKCGKCEAELSIRSDDAPEIVRQRLATYHVMTEPLTKFYEDKGLLTTVPGQDSLDDTTALMFTVLGIQK